MKDTEKGTSLARVWKGTQRADWPEFSLSKWEIQVLYNTGWETVEAPDPHLVEQAWAGWRKRNFKIRLLRDGKRVR